MEIKIIKNSISREELIDIANEEFGDVIKVVVDIEQEIMAVGGELHADEESLLMEQCDSKRQYLWGINLYPKKTGEERIEFDSMINIKPIYGNRLRGVGDEAAREKIKEIVRKLIIE